MDRLFTVGQSMTIQDLRDGGVFLVDKPLEWTSFDVVNKLRFAIRHTLGVKKFKVGHAGTLDPLATGLLVICFSKYTKKIEELTGYSKTYTGTIKMWATTPSYDSEWVSDTYYPMTEYSAEQVEQARQSFLGPIEQLPPIFSAIKQKGVALYKLARRGKKPIVDPRPVTIHRFELADPEWPLIDFEAEVSKGTYIRSLAHDFGQKLNNGAHLSSLRRTAVGDFSVSDAWSVHELCDYIRSLTPTTVDTDA